VKKKESVDRYVNELESQVEKVVRAIMELKKKEKKWYGERAEIEKRITSLLKRIESLNDEKGS